MEGMSLVERKFQSNIIVKLQLPEEMHERDTFLRQFDEYTADSRDDLYVQLVIPERYANIFFRAIHSYNVRVISRTTITPEIEPYVAFVKEKAKTIVERKIQLDRHITINGGYSPFDDNIFHRNIFKKYIKMVVREEGDSFVYGLRNIEERTLEANCCGLKVGDPEFDEYMAFHASFTEIEQREIKKLYKEM